MTNLGIPDWARWIAMDEDGLWWCYEVEPHQHDRGWYENEVGRCQKIIASQLQTLTWKDSLKKLN